MLDLGKRGDKTHRYNARRQYQYKDLWWPALGETSQGDRSDLKLSRMRESYRAW